LHILFGGKTHKYTDVFIINNHMFYLLWVDLVIELEHIHDPLFNRLQGERGKVSILSARHTTGGDLGRRKRMIMRRMVVRRRRQVCKALSADITHFHILD